MFPEIDMDLRSQVTKAICEEIVNVLASAGVTVKEGSSILDSAKYAVEGEQNRIIAT
jgi:hypothetical protein